MDAMPAPQPNARQRRAQQRLARQLGEVGFALPGSVIERHTTCGKAGCRCTADPPELHGPYIQWTRKVDGHTVTKLLSPEQRDRYQPWFDNARRLRELIAELEALSLRHHRGRRELERRLNPPRPHRTATTLNNTIQRTRPHAPPTPSSYVNDTVKSRSR